MPSPSLHISPSSCMLPCTPRLYSSSCSCSPRSAHDAHLQPRRTSKAPPQQATFLGLLRQPLYHYHPGQLDTRNFIAHFPVHRLRRAFHVKYIFCSVVCCVPYPIHFARRSSTHRLLLVRLVDALLQPSRTIYIAFRLFLIFHLMISYEHAYPLGVAYLSPATSCTIPPSDHISAIT